MTIDPITLEVLWNRLIAVVNEQATALMRTSFTTVVRESGDLSAGVFDRRGNMIAQAVTGTPGHINSMATCIHHFLAVYPRDTLRPGDVLITNDPQKTSGQLHDFTVITPIFDGQDRLVAFFGSTCHAIDIGGRGLSADARSVYEEGLFVPITKWRDAGRPNEELVKIIRANVREPEQVLGDIHAQEAGNDGRRRAAAGVSGRVRPARPRRPGRRDHQPFRTRDARGDRHRAGRRLHAHELQRRLRRASEVAGDDHEARRHNTRRLDRHRPGKPARHQRRPQLHPRVRHLRAEVRALPRGAEQRRLLPARDRHRAARLPAERAAARAGRRPPRHRPFPPRHHLRRARAGASPTGSSPRARRISGRRNSPAAAPTPARPGPTSGSPAAAWARGRRATACTRPPSPPV